MNAPVTDLTGEPLPQWNLDDLYAGRNDPRIEADLTSAAEANAALAALEGQFVASRADKFDFGKLISNSYPLSKTTEALAAMEATTEVKPLILTQAA